MEFYNQILSIASLAAKVMLENGGETYRVEQVVRYICKSFGIDGAESYATPTVIIVSIYTQDGQTHSTMRRISSRTNNLSKVSAVNDLSYELALGCCEADIEKVRQRLLDIQNKAGYTNLTQIIASMFLAASFAGMIGSHWQDFVSALFAGGIVRAVVVLLTRYQVNEFMINLLGGMVASFLGFLSVYVGFGQEWSNITISALMLLLPGLIMVNAIRDIVVGDLVSGISRGFEAVFIVGGIAAGAAITHILVALWGFAI